MNLKTYQSIFIDLDRVSNPVTLSQLVPLLGKRYICNLLIWQAVFTFFGELYRICISSSVVTLLNTEGGGGGGVALVKTGENGEILRFETPFHHKNCSPFFAIFHHLNYIILSIFKQSNCMRALNWSCVTQRRNDN